MDVQQSRLLVAVLFCLIVSCSSLTCPDGGKPLPPASCVRLSSSRSSQSTVCGDSGDGPLRLTAAAQFGILASYAQVVGREGEFYWLGYRFDSSGNLIDVDSTISNVLTDDMNYGDEGQVDAGEGVCLAMGQDGQLYRRTCATELIGFCYQLFERPNATLYIADGLDRYVTLTTGIQLMCDASEGSEVTWRVTRAGETGAGVIDPPDITSFSEDDAGPYYCIASNPLGAFVSDPVVLVFDHTNQDRTESVPEVTMTSQPTQGQFGSNLTLTCDYTSTLPVTNTNWFINGCPVAETSRVNQMSSTLVVRLRKEGFYQCFIRTENGNVGSASLFVQAQNGLPSAVDEISALPDTQTSIIVTWLCPLNINTVDEALLRYRLFYQQGFEVNMDSSEVQFLDNLLPTLTTGNESSNCLVEAVIPGLETGTTYALKVVAVSPQGMLGEVAEAFAVTNTYGEVPGVVEGLKVRRTPDNKTVHATWEELKTTLPVGMVSRYKIEYRDLEKNSVSTVFHAARFNFLVVTNVINANTYEVRVSAGTAVRRTPKLEFAFGMPTNWTKVDGISTNVPSVPPTVKLRTEPAVGALAAGISVGVVALIVTVAILIAGLVCYIYKKRGTTKSYAVRTLQEDVDKLEKVEMSKQ